MTTSPTRATRRSSAAPARSRRASPPEAGSRVRGPAPSAGPRSCPGRGGEAVEEQVHDALHDHVAGHAGVVQPPLARGLDHADRGVAPDVAAYGVPKAALVEQDLGELAAQPPDERAHRAVRRGVLGAGAVDEEAVQV